MGKGRALKLFGTRAVFENLDTGSCLVVTQLKDGLLDTQTCDTTRIPDAGSPTQIIPFEAIFGFYGLLSGPYVALVVETEPYVSVPGQSIVIRKAKKIILIPLFINGKQLSTRDQRDEDVYLYLLHSAFASHQFFYSPTYDMTHTQQRISKFTSKQLSDPLWTRADDRFFWNKELISDLMKRNADEWIVPFMSAYIEIQTDCAVDSQKFALIFISRRSRFRQGCRFTKRGIDDNGNVANFVETEQVLAFPTGRITSYVQIRGSIPVPWSSPVTMKYAPKVYIDDNREKAVDLCEKHIRETLDIYSDSTAKSGLIIVNLVDNKKEQGQLGVYYKEVIDLVRARIPSQRTIEYVWFDFHHETSKKGKWQNLSNLIHMVDRGFQQQSFFSRSADGAVQSQQLGVIRTNCMDNLDRTNVVQSLFARRSLLMQLGKSGLLESPDNILDTPWKPFEKIYKSVWTNNANAISTLYAGTGALKVDFTKTGKRTKMGAINDGINSIMRYYINNFTDGVKQDSIDLLLGNFKPTTCKMSPFVVRHDQETLAANAVKAFVFMMIIFSALLLVFPGSIDGHRGFNNHSFHLLASFLVTILIVVIIMYFVVMKGSKIGERLVIVPQLLPEAILG